MNRKIISVFSGLIILLIAYFISSLIINSEEETLNNNTNITHLVNSINIKNQSNPISVKVNGSLKSKHQIEIFSEVQGKLERSSKEFKSGQNYSKGNVLIKIDSKEFLASVKQNRSQLQNLVASVLPDIKLDFPKSFPQWENYFKEFNVNSNTKPLPDHNSEKEKFYIVGKGLQSQYFRLKNLEERLNKYTLLSPYDGTLKESYVSEGALISPGQKLGTFINTDLFELEVSVPSKYGNKLEIGKEVTLNSTYNTNHSGKIIRINNSIDYNSQSIRVFIEFKSEELKDGMYSEVEIPLGTIDDSFLLSRSLLINNSFVYFINTDMTIGLMNVEPKFYDDEYVVVKGLDDGLQILKSYIPGIYDGMKVKIVD